MVVAAAGLARPTNLPQKLPRSLKFQDLVVGLVVARNPHVELGVHVDPVLVQGPLVTGSWPAPAREQVAIAVELQHGRSANAANHLRRGLTRRSFTVRDRTRSMQDPDMIPRVDRYAGDLTQDPTVG